jgi:general secretion pathway protein A
MLNYYALRDDPFSPTSHPAWFFASQSHTAALQTLLESLKAGEDFAVLLGEPGVGKTFLVDAALAHRDLQHRKIVHVWYPTCSFHDTLHMIGWEFGLDTVASDTAKLTQALHRALLTEYERGRQVVVVIDEAHTMPFENLERLIRLSHVRALTGEPLLQMLLVGLPTLGHHFSAPPLRSCQPHRVTRVTLAPLTYDESAAYIRHRLQQAGAGDGTIFTSGAVRHVARHARGNLRVINMLCTHMLLAGFDARQKPIAAAIAKDVITAYNPNNSHRRWWGGVTVTASVLAVAGIVGLFPITHRIVTNRSSGGCLPCTRRLLAGAGVETAQQPAKTASSLLGPTLSVQPTPTAPASPEMAPTEMPTLSMQGAALPETSVFQTSPPMSPVTDHIPQAVQHAELLLPVGPEQPVALPTLREVDMPSKPSPSRRATPTPLVITTRITSPQDGATVARKIAVEGVIAGVQPDHHVFLCVQSQAFGRRIYPQGRVRPDPIGQWTVESIYGSSGYRYETFLVITTNPESVVLLNAQQSRKYGLRDLPPSIERIGTAIVVMRE